MAKGKLVVLLAACLVFLMLPLACDRAVASEAGTIASMPSSKAPAGAIADIDGVEYDSLASAFERAESDDTIRLLDNVDLTETVSVDKKIALDLDGKTIKVSIDGGEGVTVSAFDVVEGGNLSIENGYIFGSGKMKDNRAIRGEKGSKVKLTDVWIGRFYAKSGNGGAVCMDSGKLEISGGALGFWDEAPDAPDVNAGNFALNGGAVWAKDTDVSIAGATELWFNESKDTSGNVKQPWFGGGAIYVEGANSAVDVNGAWFYQNDTDGHGGGIHLDDVGSANIVGNTIQECSARNGSLPDSRGGDGRESIFASQPPTVLGMRESAL